MNLPEFVLGSQYRELRGGNYRFELLTDISVVVPYLVKIDHTPCVSFRDNRKKEWARLTGAALTIRAGYRWNGSSPKWWVPLIGWVGTPDPIPTRLASLVHDVCFQFLRTADWPIPYEECNSLFHQIMVALNFKRANTYHGAVKDFGKLFCGNYPAKGEHSVLLDDHELESQPCAARP